MVKDEEQPSVAGEPETLSDGSGEFYGALAFGLLIVIVAGGIGVAAVTVIHVLKVYGYL